MCSLRDQFLAGMRQVASSVTIIATELDGEPRGLTATSVCSLSVDPPSFVVCVNRRAAAREFIRRSRHFSINVLCRDQESIARCFSGGVEHCRGGDRFSLGQWGRLVTGAPILLSSAANFDCELYQSLECDTHDVLIGYAVAAQADEQRMPLLYRNRRYVGLT